MRSAFVASLLLLIAHTVHSAAIDDLLLFFHDYATAPSIEEQEPHTGIIVQVQSGFVSVELDSLQRTFLAEAIGANLESKELNISAGNTIGMTNSSFTTNAGASALNANITNTNPISVDVDNIDDIANAIANAMKNGGGAMAITNNGSECLKVELCCPGSETATVYAWEGPLFEEETLTPAHSTWGAFDGNMTGIAETITAATNNPQARFETFGTFFSPVNFGQRTSFEFPFMQGQPMNLDTSAGHWGFFRKILLFVLYIQLVHAGAITLRQGIA